MRGHILICCVIWMVSIGRAAAQSFTDDPERVTLHTEDIERFWVVFDKTSPRNYAADESLLAQSIREGAADFICELASGSHPFVDIHAFGNAHEQELWSEFLMQKDSPNWTPWLYHTASTSRPKDLGYKISKAYYNRAADKPQVIRDILTIQNFPKFLPDSGYNGYGTNTNPSQP